MSDSKQWDRGQDILRKLTAGQPTHDDPTVNEIFPDFWKMQVEHLFGGVWSRPDLGLKERIMVNLAGLIFHKFNFGIANRMRWAVNNGISREEVLEIILHTANYTCWGSGVEATRAAKD